MENKNTTITQLSVKNALIISLITIVISVCFYLVDPLLMYTNFWVGMLSFVLFIVLLVVVGLSIRKTVGGYWTFGEAFKSFLIMALILTISTTIYNILLMSVIDPDLPARAGVAIEDSQRQMMENLGLSTEEIDTALEKSGSMEERLQITFKNVVTSFGVGLAVYGVISLILAVILKKTPPFFVPGKED